MQNKRLLVPRIFKQFTVCAEFCFDFGCLLIEKREDLQLYAPKIRDNITLYFSVAPTELLLENPENWSKDYPRLSKLHVKVTPKKEQVTILAWDARGSYSKSGKNFSNEHELFKHVDYFFSHKDLW